MTQSSEFKGHYCVRCHTYSRLYRNASDGNFYGKCPGCGVQLFVSGFGRDHSLFKTGEVPGRSKTINVWDNYQTGKIIGQVPLGTPAKVLGQAVFNGVTWFNIQTAYISGWVSGAFIKPIRGKLSKS